MIVSYNFTSYFLFNWLEQKNLSTSYYLGDLHEALQVQI